MYSINEATIFSCTLMNTSNHVQCDETFYIASTIYMEREHPVAYDSDSIHFGTNEIRIIKVFASSPSEV